jgi:hypothetical protein
MEFQKLKLAAVDRNGSRKKTPRITVRSYTGEFNKLGKDCLAQVCKAWGLPLKHPAALALHTAKGDSEYQLCAVPVMEATEGDVRITTSQDSQKIKVDLFDYMHSINLHLGSRSRWVIYVKVAPGVDGKPCLFLDTQTDLEAIRKAQAAGQGDTKTTNQHPN